MAISIQRREMKKWLLFLLGLLFIVLLALFCFNSKYKEISKDLITNTKSTLGKMGNTIEVEVKGSEYNTTRIITLKGIVPNKEAKMKAQELTEGVAGVSGVDNQLVIAKANRVDTAHPKGLKMPKKTKHLHITDSLKTKTPKLETTQTVSPYKLAVSKDKSGTIELRGFVPNQNIRHLLLSGAQDIFDKSKIIDRLQIHKGAPKLFANTAMLGLQSLKGVDYGEFDINDNNFTFNGHVTDKKSKDILLNNFANNLNSIYKGSYNIDAPQKQKVAKQESIKKELTGCKSKIHKILANKKIHFEYDKAAIKHSSYRLLNNLANVIKNCPDTIVYITGHTDSIGSATYNKALSQKRANSVKQFLVHKGIKKQRLKAIGYGESRPIASNKTKEGRKKNRRIEFKFKGAK